jgi:hypothetical protein
LQFLVAGAVDLDTAVIAISVTAQAAERLGLVAQAHRVRFFLEALAR